MNTLKDIKIKYKSIKLLLDNAALQYKSQKKTANNPCPEYHALFILIRNISANGTFFSTDSTTEGIFDEAVENYKHSVEAFTKQNVMISTTVKKIDDIAFISKDRRYLVYEDVRNHLKELEIYGKYDAVFVATAECGVHGAVTTFSTFRFESLLFGFTHFEIVSGDSLRYNKNYTQSYPHLITTNYIIHEHLHQLECYRKKIAAFYPDTHGYADPDSYGYSWDTSYFDDKEKYPHIIENSGKKLTSFYRAVLAGEIIYTYKNGRKRQLIGMMPSFWNITPKRLFIGKYFIKKKNGDYYYNDDGKLSAKELNEKDKSFVWNIYYSFSSKTLKIKNFEGKECSIPLIRILRSDLKEIEQGGKQ